MDTTTLPPTYGIRRKGSTHITQRTVWFPSARVYAAQIAHDQAHPWEIVELPTGNVVAEVDRYGRLTNR